MKFQLFLLQGDHEARYHLQTWVVKLVQMQNFLLLKTWGRLHPHQSALLVS